LTAVAGVQAADNCAFHPFDNHDVYLYTNV